MAVLQVDYAEASHPEAEVIVDNKPCVVRASMDEAIALPRNDIWTDRTSHLSVPAGNSTHAATPWKRAAIGPHEGLMRSGQRKFELQFGKVGKS